MQFYPALASIALERKHEITLQGTGNGTAPTVTLGHRITATWIATGRVTLTWSDNPGTFVGIESGCFRDNSSQGNVKGWTMTAGAYPATASTFTLEIDFWNSSFAAADLATTSFIDLVVKFSELKNP